MSFCADSDFVSSDGQCCWRNFILNMNYPAIIDCDEDGCIEQLSANPTVEELTKHIKKAIAICGIVDTEYGLGVNFIHTEPIDWDEFDYSFGVCHAIDPKFSGYYTGRSNREKIPELQEKITQAMIDFGYHPNSQSLEKHIDEMIQELEKYFMNPDVILRANHGQFFTKPSHGMQVFINVPLKLQIEACAIVMECSVEKAWEKILSVTHPSMRTGL